MKKFSLFIFTLFCVHLAFPQSYSGGYYFLNKFKLLGSPIQQYQMILDDNGDVVYLQQVKSVDFKLNANGLISYHALNKWWLMDSTFYVVDSVGLKHGLLIDNHDFQILPNGHFLMLGREDVTEDLSGYHYFGGIGAAGSTHAGVNCSVIQEQDVNKNVVFEWHTKNYFQFDDVDTFFLDNPNVVDWTHSNSVEMDTDGNIILSNRGFDEITKISHSDSSIIWRFGGKRNQFTYLSDTIRFYGQHDVRRIANGHITVFDNGYHAPTHGARALEYALDELNKTADLKWRYVYDSAMYSRAMGNVQRLGNGNTVISYGDISSVNNICFAKVDTGGTVLFPYIYPDSSMSYRAFYYPQLPFQLHRPVITCFDSAGTYYLDAGVGYSSYNWSDGSSSQLLPIVDTGTYNVFVPYGQNGLINSEKFVVSNLSNPCGMVSSVGDIEALAVKIIPNISDGKFTLYSGNIFLKEISVYSLTGALLKQESLSGTVLLSYQIDLSNYPSGSYLARVVSNEGSSATVRLSLFNK